ncbi:MAG: phosphotransferase [Reichenbachiella sp.]
MNFIDPEMSSFELQEILESKGWILNEKVIKTDIPGEGNMNVVMRVTTQKRTFILKQSRPFVQKYQQIAAPIDRINTEFQFYQATKRSGLSKGLPEVLAFDKADHLLMMEDIEGSMDMVALYQEKSISHHEIETLVIGLRNIHKCNSISEFPENLALRELNHQHVFVLPFMEDNGFNLDDVQNGLRDISAIYRSDSALKKTIGEIGKIYLSKGEYLLHGDYYPGSWIRGTRGIFVIDPEFSFMGFREYDLGVMIAHLILVTGSENKKQEVLSLYNVESVDASLINKIAGIEIMRRIIGLAQLPLIRTLEEKSQLLQLAHRLIMS